MSSFSLVAAFHRIFNHPAPAAPSSKNLADAKLRRLRVMLIAHELAELCQGLAIDLDMRYVHADMHMLSGKELEQYIIVNSTQPDDLPAPDMVLTADALGDLDYVVNGGGVAFGIELPSITAEVHASNMSKLDEDGNPILDPDTGKVIKGPNFLEPDIAGVLAAQSAVGEQAGGADGQSPAPSGEDLPQTTEPTAPSSSAPAPTSTQTEESSATDGSADGAAAPSSGIDDGHDGSIV